MGSPYYKALEVWTAQTLCDVGILLSILSFILYLARPYFERVLRSLTLRVAADLWWVAYLVLRDGSLLVASLFGILYLNLDLMADIKVGLPFVPLGTAVMGAALVVKVFHVGRRSSLALERESGPGRDHVLCRRGSARRAGDLGSHVGAPRRPREHPRGA